MLSRKNKQLCPASYIGRKLWLSDPYDRDVSNLGKIQVLLRHYKIYLYHAKFKLRPSQYWFSFNKWFEDKVGKRGLKYGLIKRI